MGLAQVGHNMKGEIMYTAENWPITKATLNLTRACNLNCKYCFTYGCTQGDMSLETGKKIVDFLFKESARCDDPKAKQAEVSFWGGEPLLKWRLLQDIANYAIGVSKKTARGVTFGGTTNGTLLTPDKFDYLDSIKCKFLVSFDGTPESHNMYRKFRDGTGSHKVVEKNLIAALTRWPDYRIRLSNLAERVEHFYDDMKYCIDLGCNHVMFSPVFEGPWDTEKWEIWAEQAKKVIDLIATLKDQGRRIVVEHFNSYGSCDESIYPCGAGRFYAGFDIDGSIYPCHRFNKLSDTRPWQEKEVCIGHVDHGITNVAFRDRFINWKHGCGDCGRLKDTPCHGGCYAVRFDLTGRLDYPASIVCEYVEAQKKVSEYYLQKGLPTQNATKGGNVEKSCICYNMCYSENTPEEIRTPDANSGETCVCYNVGYTGPAEPQARQLRVEEKGQIIPFTIQDRESLKSIFRDISRRLARIEETLGIHDQRPSTG